MESQKQEFPKKIALCEHIATEDQSSYIMGYIPEKVPIKTIDLTSEGNYVVAYTKAYCKFQDTIEVESINCKLYIPNAFSPNRNMENNTFSIIGENIKSVNLSVYDRYGKKVFKSDPNHTTWDGTISNTTAGEGVYTYTVSATFKDNTQLDKVGQVTLIR